MRPHEFPPYFIWDAAGAPRAEATTMLRKELAFQAARDRKEVIEWVLPWTPGSTEIGLPFSPIKASMRFNVRTFVLDGRKLLACEFQNEEDVATYLAAVPNAEVRG